MALITCPECGKQISDRASICPNCGFPIQEHLAEEKALDVEKQKNEKKKQIQALVSRKQDFAFFNKTLSLSYNDVVCGLVGKSIDASLENVKKTFLKEYQSLSISDFGERDLLILARNLYQSIVEDSLKTVEALKHLNVIYLAGKGINFTFDEWHCDYIGFEDFVQSFQDDFYQLRKNSVDAQTAINRSRDSVVRTYQNGNIIDSVYSNSVGGLIGQSIKASVINGVSNSFSHSKMKKELKKIEKQENDLISSFQKTLSEIINDKVVDVVLSIYISLMNLYVDVGIVVDYVEFPKSSYDLTKASLTIRDQFVAQSQKVQLLYEMFQNDPFNETLYRLCVNNLVFNESAVKGFEDFIEFNYMKACITGEDDYVHYSMDRTTCSLLKFEGIQFSSLSEKENYISDKKVYDKLLEDYFHECQWYDFNKMQSRYDEIFSKPKPESKEFQDALAILKTNHKVLLRFHTPFIDLIFDPLMKIKSDFNVVELLREYYEPSSDGPKGLLSDEVVIKTYKYGSLNDNEKYNHEHGLIITNLRMCLMYTCNNEIFYSFFPTSEYVKRFTPTNNSIIFKSLSQITFNEFVKYSTDPKTKNSFKSTGYLFYTDAGALGRHVEGSDGLDEFAALYTEFQNNTVGKRFDVANFKIQFTIEDIDLLPYTLVLENLENIDIQSKGFKEWYEKHRVNIEKYSDFRLRKANYKKETNESTSKKSNEEDSDFESALNEYRRLIEITFPDYFDRNNFLKLDNLNNQSENCKKAFEILLDLDNRNCNNTYATYDLGMAYCYGMGVGVDYEKAEEIFKETSSMIPDSLYHLAHIYSVNENLQPKYYNWNEEIVRAARNESPQALFRLCIWCQKEMYGFSWDQNTKNTVANMLHKLSELGSRAGQYQLVSYNWSYNKKASYEETVGLLLQLLKNKTPNDRVNLGNVYHMLYLYYEQGKVVSKDADVMLHYLKSAADNNHRVAQRYLGEYYLKGQFVPKDREKAKYWLIKSAENDDDKAKKYLMREFKLNYDETHEIPSSDTEKNTEISTDKMKVICSNCGRSISENAKFCNFCGHPNSVKKCQKCGKYINRTTKFCNYCGTKQ